MIEIEAEIAVMQPGVGLGEGLIYDPRSKKMLWLDILGPTLFRWDPHTKQNEVFDLKGNGVRFVSSVVPLDHGNGDVVAITIENGFATYDFGKRKLTTNASNPSVSAGERFNDGKVDPAGRYWAGTLVRDVDNNIVANKGTLYRRDLNGSVTTMLTPVTISNGICWSADSRTMYYIDTPTKTVQSFDFDVTTGSITAGRPAVTGFTGGDGADSNRPGPADGWPDGCCLDSDVRLWVARFNGGGVSLYSLPQGRSDATRADQPVGVVRVPASCGFQTTSVAFDAKGDMYITTAREFFSTEQMAKFPHSGALCVVRREALVAAGLASRSSVLLPPPRGLKAAL